MNIKIRVALLFNFFVAIILLFLCLVIYFLYRKFKEDDFKQRLTLESNELYNEYNLITANDSIPLSFLSQLHNNNLTNQQLTFLNNKHKVLYNYPIKPLPDYLQDTSIYRKAKQQKIIKFNTNNTEVVGIFYPETSSYVFASATDVGGLRKLKKLRFILISFFFGTLLISVIIAFFFVQQAFEPLAKLSKQMEDTTAHNLTKKIDEGKGNDEISLIAKNFNAMLGRLNKAFETQKTFVQNASHELRTPLATMLSQTEAALNRNLDCDGYKKVMLSLKEDQTDLIELTNSLLLISQYENITTLSSLPKLRVDELLYDTISTCVRMFEGIDIDLNFKELPDEEAELMICCNDSLLKSAFRNLIKNAYYYSDNKKVSVVIVINRPNIIIKFINTGNQLIPTEVDKIKMPFFRGQNSSTKKGYGLGLSIVSRVIELHKGTINYQAINTNENRFTITLPMA